MSGEKICIFNKFGYCRLMGDCKFFHTEEICQDSLCEVKNCNKRHPSACRFFLHYGTCKFGTNCRYDHDRINTKCELQGRMKALEEMCASLKSRCDEVNKECKELREDAQRKKSEYESVLKENEILRNVNKKLEDQLGELESLKENRKEMMRQIEEIREMSNIKRKRVLNGEEVNENLSNSKEQKLDFENITLFENGILQIKNHIMKERMTKTNVNECKEKIRNFINNIKNMKIDNQNETILVKIIEDICDKLDKTIYSSFKKVAVNEFDRFLKISTVEKQKILKK